MERWWLPAHHMCEMGGDVGPFHLSSWDSPNEGARGCPSWMNFFLLKRCALLTPSWTLYIVESVCSFQLFKVVWASQSLQEIRMLAGEGEECGGGIQGACISKEEIHKAATWYTPIECGTVVIASKSVPWAISKRYWIDRSCASSALTTLATHFTLWSSHNVWFQKRVSWP